ncbi:hypothetical protein [Methanoculleus sp. 7T]|nr:hypothetical protein [Methanoculleus sp. 7T]MCK8519546.1 hypothetical protein [Methanoculleus sp. 7T]
MPTKSPAAFAAKAAATETASRRIRTFSLAALAGRRCPEIRPLAPCF